MTEQKYYQYHKKVLPNCPPTSPNLSASAALQYIKMISNSKIVWDIVKMLLVKMQIWIILRLLQNHQRPKKNDFQFFASDEDETKLLLECLLGQSLGLGQPEATKISRFLIKTNKVTSNLFFREKF